MASSGTEFAVRAATVFDGEALLQDHCIVVRDGTIAQLLPAADCELSGLPCTHLESGILAPGLIDLQVNGGGGVMLNNAPTADSVDRMVAAHRARGTTAMTPTLISDTAAVQQSAVNAVREARRRGNHSVLGIHLEGPHFELSRRGTHKAGMIRKAGQEDIDWLCGIPGDDLLVIATLAPEHLELEQIEQLAAAGIRVCAGHTNAGYADTTAAIEAGLSGFTHLFNAMSPLTAREPGAVGAALDSDNCWAGIIVDGHHLHPATVRIACRVMPAGRVFLVSDAMATVGSDQPAFKLYGETIAEQDGRLVNREGALAGSAIGMLDAVRIAHTEAGLPRQECLRMASLYPARYIGLGHSLGRLASGYRADFIHFDDQYQLLNSWVAGQHRGHGA
jgi:N-acetylglucosamine-6-phosphate deacetylase